MSVGATPSLNFIGDTVGDVAPHSMSEMRGIRFASGNSPTTGSISLSDFRNETITTAFDEQAKIQSSDIQLYDNFGYSVSISEDGNTAIVGALTEDTGADNAGAAYIFTRSDTTWTQLQKIQASDKQANDQFGWSVAISGDGNTTIVGSVYEDSTGAAYIFTRSGTTWTQQQEIQASDKQGLDQFGYSVAISENGNTAIVGARGEDTGGNATGAAYIFTRSGTSWTQQQKIQASDKQADDQFGQSVAISGDGNTAIVGARLESTGGLYAGAAYIFTWFGTTWTQQQKIQASDKQAGDEFGFSVDISGDGNTAIVGAYKEDSGGAYAGGIGAAYIFTRGESSWSEQQKIQPSDTQNVTYFGHSVGISDDGNTAIMGSPLDHTYFGGAGAAYIFTRSGTTWTQQQEILSSDLEGRDQFGQSVAISGDGNTNIVGAIYEGAGATGAGSGSAYIYRNSYYI